jgi:hypothetical protein
MACKIQNLSKYRLSVDLRGGERIVLNPSQISHPLREEVLYGNPYMPEWQRKGVVRITPAKMAEVDAYEGRAPAPAAKPAKDRDTATGAESGGGTSKDKGSVKSTDGKTKNH